MAPGGAFRRPEAPSSSCLFSLCCRSICLALFRYVCSFGLGFDPGKCSAAEGFDYGGSSGISGTMARRSRSRWWQGRTHLKECGVNWHHINAINFSLWAGFLLINCGLVVRKCTYEPTNIGFDSTQWHLNIFLKNFTVLFIFWPHTNCMLGPPLGGGCSWILGFGGDQFSL